MTWFRCMGCGPSLRCPVCGATECAQNLGEDKDCPGCKEVMKKRGTVCPWNTWIPSGVRPFKHNRKWRTRDRIVHKMNKRSGMYADMRKWVRRSGRWVINPHGLESLIW